MNHMIDRIPINKSNTINGTTLFDFIYLQKNNGIKNYGEVYTCIYAI